METKKISDKATPRLWKVEKGWILSPELGRSAMPIIQLKNMDNAEANAALIVRAVNSHEALVKALRDMVTYQGMDYNDDRRIRAIQNAEAALRLAEGDA